MDRQINKQASMLRQFITNSYCRDDWKKKLQRQAEDDTDNDDDNVRRTVHGDGDGVNNNNDHCCGQCLKKIII